MEYIEITVRTTSEAADLVADVFFDFTVEGVSIVDKEDLKNLNKKCHHWDYIEEDIFAKYGEEALVVGFVEKSKYGEISGKIDAELTSLKERSKGFMNVGSLERTERTIEGDDWVNSWKEHFKPINIGKIVICPKWIDYEEKGDETKVLLDVGMAFGTGEHETTSLCISLMQSVDMTGKTVYDVGTGSGILGIAAVKLGAKKAIMSDIDEIAVAAAKNNARLNGVEDFCEITETNLLDGKTEPADVVVSNITAEVLILMADDMAKITRCGTPLILSGVLSDRLEMIKGSYGKYFDIEKLEQKGDWCGILLIRK